MTFGNRTLKPDIPITLGIAIVLGVILWFALDVAFEYDRQRRARIAPELSGRDRIDSALNMMERASQRLKSARALDERVKAANALAEAGRKDEADAAFHEIARLANQYTASWRWLHEAAVHFNNAGRPHIALPYMTAAVESAGDRAEWEMHNDHGLLLSKLKQFGAARRAFEKARDTALRTGNINNVAWPHFLMSRMYLRSGDVRRSEAELTSLNATLERSWRVQPGIQFHVGLARGSFALRRGDNSQAVAEFEEVLEIADSLEDRSELGNWPIIARARLAEALYLTGETQRAEQLFDELEAELRNLPEEKPILVRLIADRKSLKHGTKPASSITGVHP